MESVDPTSVREILVLLDLEKYARLFDEVGFTDVSTTWDSDVLDNRSLEEDLGMTKAEIRRFRSYPDDMSAYTTLKDSSGGRVERGASAREGDGEYEVGSALYLWFLDTSSIICS